MATENTGRIIADKYRVDDLVADGAFVSLFRGTNTLLEKPVSIALPVDGNGDPDRFFSEAKAAARISHPNVLNLTDFGTDRGETLYAVYESALGETLREAISREGQLPVEMAIDIAKQTGAALSAAHAGGVIHGSLTPSNIIVSSSSPGRASVKVFGFGTPNAINDEDLAVSKDSARFAYLAPEQCSGSEDADRRGDVYSLGAIMFEMLSGSAPFVGETPSEVMMRQIEEPPPPLSSFRQDLPAWIEPVLLKAMAKNPDARYQSVDEFVNDLSSASLLPADSAVGATGESNNLWKTAFVVLAGISLLTVGLIYMTYSRRTDPATVLQTDANGMPVQPINPATGVEEQNLSNRPPDYTMYDANTNTMISPGGVVPGDAGNPWLNGTAPPAGAPNIGAGGQVIQVPGGNSPFMSDPNCIPQPSGIMLCTVPVNPTPTPRATPTPRTGATANTNTAPAPAATPTPQPARPSPTPARTPARPAATPAANRPAPTADSQ